MAAGCHDIPGVRGADGLGRPFARPCGRALYIAGVLPNSAANLTRGIEDPPALAPGTAMPRTGASGQEARDVAAFLYTLR